MPAAAAPIGSRLVSSTRAPWRCGMRRGVIAEQARSKSVSPAVYPRGGSSPPLARSRRTARHRRVPTIPTAGLAGDGAHSQRRPAPRGFDDGWKVDELHPGGPGDARGPKLRRRPGHHPARAGRGGPEAPLATCAATTGRSSSPRRSRTGAASLEPTRFHRARLTLAEPLRGVVQRQGEGRAAQHDRVLHAGRGRGAGGQLPDRLQRAQTALISGTWLPPCSPRVEDGSSTPPDSHRGWTGSGVRPSSLDRRQGWGSHPGSLGRAAFRDHAMLTAAGSGTAPARRRGGLPSLGMPSRMRSGGG